VVCTEHTPQGCPPEILHRLTRAANDIGRGERFDVAHMIGTGRTEQCSLRFFKENASVPAVGQMGSLAVAKAELPRHKSLAVSEAACLPTNEVVHVHEGANLAADHIGLGRGSQPIIERPALVGLKMAEADVAQLGKVDELGDGLANFRVHTAQPAVEQHRFIVFHQKTVELKIPPLSKDRDAIDIRRFPW